MMSLVLNVRCRCTEHPFVLLLFSFKIKAKKKGHRTESVTLLLLVVAVSCQAYVLSPLFTHVSPSYVLTAMNGLLVVTTATSVTLRTITFSS